MAVRDDVVEEELLGAGELTAAPEEREDPALMGSHETLVDRLVEGRPAELVAVLLVEALDLAVSEEWQARQRRQERCRPEVLVAVAEGVDGRLLVGVRHEVDEPPQHLWVE